MFSTPLVGNGFDIKKTESKFPERIRLKYRSKNSNNYQPIVTTKTFLGIILLNFLKKNPRRNLIV